MSKIRGEELWARECIRGVLEDARVTLHDDGTSTGMYDLEIRYPDGRIGAVEITAAADADSIELWNLMSGRGDRWLVPGLAGGWAVSLLPNARGRRVLTELPRLLGDLEGEGIRKLRAPDADKTVFEERAHDLGVAQAFQGDTDYPGSIYITVDLPADRSGGIVPATGDPVAIWLGGWLHAAEQAHNLKKLMHSGAAERHMFVILPGFSSVPFPVADLLMRDGAPLPTINPTLPTAVTNVWAMSTWNTGSGIRWSRAGAWERFDKKVTVMAHH